MTDHERTQDLDLVREPVSFVPGPVIWMDTTGRWFIARPGAEARDATPEEAVSFRAAFGDQVIDAVLDRFGAPNR